MSDKVRVLRILEYVGDREWVEETLKKTYIPLNGMISGKPRFAEGNCIKSAIIDGFPEILEQDRQLHEWKLVWLSDDIEGFRCEKCGKEAEDIVGVDKYCNP